MEENNKISNSTLIVNESNTNNKIEIESNNDNDNEGSPILSQLEPIMSSSIEEYYKINFPEYKIIKIHKLIFIKMGNLLTFNFDSNFIPKLSIGPHWYLTLVLLLLIFFLSFMLYIAIFNQADSVKKIIFFFLILIEYFLVIKTALTHVQVVMNKKKSIDTGGFCSICNVYFNPNNKVEHCRFCGVCIEKMDHHCVWMGKCVAKNNTFYFYAMIFDLGLIYAYVIFCGIYMAITKK